MIQVLRGPVMGTARFLRKSLSDSATRLQNLDVVELGQGLKDWGGEQVRQFREAPMAATMKLGQTAIKTSAVLSAVTTALAVGGAGASIGVPLLYACSGTSMLGVGALAANAVQRFRHDESDQGVIKKGLQAVADTAEEAAGERSPASAPLAGLGAVLMAASPLLPGGASPHIMAGGLVTGPVSVLYHGLERLGDRIG